MNEMQKLAAATLAKMPTTRRSDRGLAVGHKSMTVITFVDGSADRAWGHINGRQASNLQRKRRNQIAKVEHVIADRDGHGDIVETIGRFDLIGLTLREIA